MNVSAQIYNRSNDFVGSHKLMTFTVEKIIHMWTRHRHYGFCQYAFPICIMNGLVNLIVKCKIIVLRKLQFRFQAIFVMNAIVFWFVACNTM